MFICIGEIFIFGGDMSISKFPGITLLKWERSAGPLIALRCKCLRCLGFVWRKQETLFGLDPVKQLGLAHRCAGHYIN
jgi:hypothetical protein